MHDALEGVGIVILAGLHADHAGRNVGTVVRDALRIVQHIQEDHAGIDGAHTVLQAADVLIAQAFHHHINDLFQRLHLAGRAGIVVLKDIIGQGQDALHGVFQQLQLFLGALAELRFLLFQLLRLFHDVHGVVADALKLGDKVQQLGHGMALVITKLLIGQFDKVVGDGHFHAVDEVFPHLDGADGLFIHLQQQRGGQVDVAGRTAGHLDHRVLGLLQGNSRAFVQTLVQHGHTQFLCFLGVVRHGEHGQFGQHAAAGQEQQHGADAGQGMDIRNGTLIHHVMPHGDADGELHRIDQRQQDDTADDVEIQMDQSGTLAVLGGAADGQQRGEGRANVGTQDDGDGRAEGDQSGAGQRLQDTHRSGRGLDDHGDHQTHQNTQDGVGHGHEQVLEHSALAQGGHAGVHQAHAGEQDAEAQHDLTNVLFLGIAQKDIKNAADKRHHGRKRLGLDQGQPQAVA